MAGPRGVPSPKRSTSTTVSQSLLTMSEKETWKIEVSQAKESKSNWHWDCSPSSTAASECALAGTSWKGS